MNNVDIELRIKTASHITGHKYSEKNSGKRIDERMK